MSIVRILYLSCCGFYIYLFFILSHWAELIAGKNCISSLNFCVWKRQGAGQDLYQTQKSFKKVLAYLFCSHLTWKMEFNIYRAQCSVYIYHITYICHIYIMSSTCYEFRTEAPLIFCTQNCVVGSIPCLGSTWLLIFIKNCPKQILDDARL